MYIDDISWITAGEPDTTGWPIEEVQIDDANGQTAVQRHGIAGIDGDVD